MTAQQNQLADSFEVAFPTRRSRLHALNSSGSNFDFSDNQRTSQLIRSCE